MSYENCGSPNRKKTLCSGWSLFYSLGGVRSWNSNHFLGEGWSRVLPRGLSVFLTANPFLVKSTLPQHRLQNLSVPGVFHFRGRALSGKPVASETFAVAARVLLAAALAARAARQKCSVIEDTAVLSGCLRGRRRAPGVTQEAVQVFERRGPLGGGGGWNAWSSRRRLSLLFTLLSKHTYLRSVMGSISSCL